ncbi:MAG TPA: amino acid adenylation domain-containing protein, partial [Ktedonobacteraceae bacterium]
MQEVTLEAQDHQDVPFEYLVRELQPERELGQNPFFQVLLLLEPPQTVVPFGMHPPNAASASSYSQQESQAGWSLSHMDVNTATSKFDLSLIIDDRPDGLLCRFEYRTDLFDAETITRMEGHWRTMLAGIASAPHRRLSELPLLTDAEREQLLVEWNATSVPYPQDQCVHQLFEAQVERTPGATALVFEEQKVTYRELNTRANQLAHRLQRLHVRSGTLVGLCMDRSIEMVVGLLAILKVGGAYVPLEPAYPRERLTFMLQDTGAPVLLTQERFIELLPLQETTVLCLDTMQEALEQESAENVSCAVQATDLAYVMYTSGSTGRPKGVEIQHRSISRLVFGVDDVRLDTTRAILHMAPISFDASTFEVWGALLHGARCVLFPERVPTPKSIGAAIRKYDITTMWLTATLFNAVIDEDPHALTSIEQLLTGGEALSVTHIRRALEKLPSTQLINGYGPHESTTFTCCYPIPRQLGATLRSIPIGRPIGNTQVYILDRHLHPVPIGVPGELHIGGAGLARGYLNHPELTNEKFIAHPFCDDPEARLYKTGDLVRYLPDGTIEFLGRLDQQVKLRGFRIELGEIEVALGQHPLVREAVALVNEH